MPRAAGGNTVNKQLSLIEPADGRLAYNGTLICDKGEMLSLTDRWDAAGRPENKRPRLLLGARFAPDQDTCGRSAPSAPYPPSQPLQVPAIRPA